MAACFLPQAWPRFRSCAAKASASRTPRQVASEDLKEAKVFRAIYSNRQLEEVLVDFWFNHFNVDEAKNVAQVQTHNHGPSADRQL